MKTLYARLLLVSLCILALASCGVRELMELHSGLTQEFSDAMIQKLTYGTSGRETVLSVNVSTRTYLPVSERDRFARRMAEYVRDHYPKYQQLDAVHIELTGDGRYRYTCTDLGSPAGATDTYTAQR